MRKSKAGKIVDLYSGALPFRERIYNVEPLPKCKYSEKIKKELQKSLASIDYFSTVKYYLGMQPLEYLPKNVSEITAFSYSSNHEIDDTFSVNIEFPHKDNLQRGIDDLNDFSYNFLRSRQDIHCYDGFAELVLLEFTRLNNPSKLEDYSFFIKKDLETLCIPFDVSEFCSVLPIDPDDLAPKMLELASGFYHSFVN